jgi:hypothetical protein
MSTSEASPWDGVETWVEKEGQRPWFVGERVRDTDGYAATVRYIGPVASAKDQTAIYLGVEWDDATRGKHDGSAVVTAKAGSKVPLGGTAAAAANATASSVPPPPPAPSAPSAPSAPLAAGGGEFGGGGGGGGGGGEFGGGGGAAPPAAPPVTSPGGTVKDETTPLPVVQEHVVRHFVCPEGAGSFVKTKKLRRGESYGEVMRRRYVRTYVRTCGRTCGRT